jgi:hypothetical protein
MGDEHSGGADAAMKLDQLGPHLGTKSGVKVRKRLVKKEQGGLTQEGAAQRHSLSLASRQLAGLPIEQVTQAEHVSDVAHPRSYIGLGLLAHPWSEGQVSADRHVRVKRIALKDHRYVTFTGPKQRDVAISDLDLAIGSQFQTCEEPEGRGLPTARRTHQDEHFALMDIKC